MPNEHGGYGKRGLTTDRAAGVVLGGFAIFILWESRNVPFGTASEPGPGTVPVLLALTLLLCSGVVVAGGAAAPRVSSLPWTEWRQAAAILGSCAFMALALERLGYRLTIFIILLALVCLVEKKGWFAGIIFALGFSLGSYFLFSTLLGVPMPRGPFGL